MALLRVVAPHYVAGAEFEKINGVWCCTNAAPIIRWMIGKPPAEIKRYLDKKKYDYEWISEER